jgi:hypothetical protein
MKYDLFYPSAGATIIAVLWLLLHYATKGFCG